MGALKESTGAAAVWPVAAAVALNLVPIAGVVFWGWSVFALVFLYWLENIAIGGRTLASMVASGLVLGGEGRTALMFLVPFFPVHYGMFCFGHGVFVVSMFGAGQGAVAGDTYNLVAVAAALFRAQPELAAGFAAILVWQGILLALFLIRGEAKGTNPLKLMGAPYPRIVVLHVTIIIGGFLVMILNQPLAGLVVMALLKAAFDVAEVFVKEPGWGTMRAMDRAMERLGLRRT